MSNDGYISEEQLEYESDDDQLQMVYSESQSGKLIDNEIAEGDNNDLADNLEEEFEDIPFVEEEEEVEEEVEIGESNGGQILYTGEFDKENNFKSEHEEETYYEKQYGEEFKEDLENERVIEEQTIVTEVIDDFSESEDENSDYTGKPVAEGSTDYSISLQNGVDLAEDEDRFKIIENEDAGYIEKEEFDEKTELEKIPVYLDFSDLLGNSNDGNISSIGSLSNDTGKFDVEFDFMKLFQPKYQEDELYSEFDSLFDGLEECIDLKFSEIFNRLKGLLHINLEEISIQLIFSDLLNFKLESNCMLSNEIKVGEILAVFNNLRKETQNGLDLYKMFSVKVSILRSVTEQFKILKNASTTEGFRLENLREAFNKKRNNLGDEDKDKTCSNKRVKSSGYNV